MSATSNFVLIAHRGNSADAPENTIASFDSALESGFPHFETVREFGGSGVRQARMGLPHVSHSGNT